MPLVKARSRSIGNLTIPLVAAFVLTSNLPFAAVPTRLVPHDSGATSTPAPIPDARFANKLGGVAAERSTGPLNGNAFAASRKRQANSNTIESSYEQIPLGFQRVPGSTGRSQEFVAQGPEISYRVNANGVQMLLAGREPGLTSPNRQQAPFEYATNADPSRLALAGQPSPPSRSRVSMVGLRFVGANPAAAGHAESELPWRTNYLAGSDKSKWRIGTPNYARVRYSDVYPNIDLAYYGNHSALEYDLVLRPGAKPERIRMAIDGATRLSIRAGDLAIRTSSGSFIEHRPVAYQRTNRGTLNVPVVYRQTRSGEIGFSLGPYDKCLPVVIDPVLSYAATVSGGGLTAATGIAVDGEGNTYIVGYTTLDQFPVNSAEEGCLGRTIAICC